MYEYGCTIERVIDGDTLDIVIDLGFKISQRMRVRLYGVNTPEMNTDAGKIAKQFVADWFSSDIGLMVHTMKDKADKYGRYLGVFYRPGDPVNLNDTLVREGYAVEYMK